MLRKLLASIVVATGVACLVPDARAQATGTTSVSINLPSFVMLYYRGSVTFTPTDAVMAALIGESANTVDEGGVVLGDFSADAGVDGVSTGFTPLGTATATVTNFWGVRSLAPSSGTTRVTVAFAPGGDTLSNGTDSIGLSGLQVRESGGAFGANATFSPTGLGAGAIQLGDVTFQVDLSAVTTSGNYTGGSIEITAENI